MVNVWLVESGTDFASRSYTLDKHVKEILDEFVTNPEKRPKSCLVFLGKILPEETQLCDNKDIKDKHTLHVMIRSVPEPMPEMMIDSKKLQECRDKLQFLRISRSARERVIDAMNMDEFLREFPLLKKDRIAQLVIKDFVLLTTYIMGKSRSEDAFLREHPILVEVVHYWLRIISTRRLSHSGSSTSLSDFPTPASPSGASAPVITPQMLQEAVAQAIRNVGVGTYSQGGLSSTPPSRNSQHVSGTLSASTSTPFASQMSQLAEFGFTDNEQNARILEETGGNVEQALELLIALRESVMDLSDRNE